MTYEFSGPLPLRALVVASVVSVLGAGVMVASSAFTWPVGLFLFGAFLILAGVSLAVAAWLVSRRQRASVSLSEDGYLVHTAAGDESGTWGAVSKVSMAQDGSRISLVEGSGDKARTTHVLRPESRLKNEAARWDALGADIASRLDKNRGYTSRPSL